MWDGADCVYLFFDIASEENKVVDEIEALSAGVWPIAFIRWVP